jgi:hypothetical protein
MSKFKNATIEELEAELKRRHEQLPDVVEGCDLPSDVVDLLQRICERHVAGGHYYEEESGLLWDKMMEKCFGADFIPWWRKFGPS